MLAKIAKMSYTDSCSALVAQCRKYGLSIKYRVKEDLIKRLQKYFGTATHDVPCQQFFTYMYTKWKEGKKQLKEGNNDGWADRQEWFSQAASDFAASSGEKDDAEYSEAQRLTHEHLQSIMGRPNPGEMLLRYYQRGKNAWLKDCDSSSEEDPVEDSPEHEEEAAKARLAAARKSSRADATKKTKAKPAVKKKTKPINLADDSASEWSPSDADDVSARDSPSDADEDSDDSEDSDEDEDDEQRSPCESWEAAAKIKKSNWGKKRV